MNVHPSGALGVALDLTKIPPLTKAQIVAVRAQVARHAKDAEDEAMLLDALGIGGAS